jgi:endo-alpha-1,4-polygalactosaminidase (GH114 family)
MISKRDQFKKVKNFFLYYGIGKAQEGSMFDVAIVEPQGQNKDSINTMQSKGTLVIAYISVMEIFQAFPYYKLLRDEDFLKMDNIPVMNKEFNTYLIDLKSQRWCAILTHHIGNLILNENYDGIFLDTIGDVEFPIFNEELQSELIYNATKLIMEIRSLYKDIIIIQNNGLNKLIHETAKFMDGVCFENPRFCDDECADWMSHITNKLINLSNEEEIKVLLLYEEKNFDKEELTIVKEAEKIAEKNKFLIFKTKSYC